MSITFRWLENDEIQLGMSYVRQLWNRNHILARNPDLFAWQYEGYPEEGHLGFLIAEDDGTPVGCVGRMAAECQIHGKNVKGAAIALLIAREEYRKRMVGINLLKQVYNDLDIIITMGINSTVARLYGMLGQNVVPQMPRFVCRGTLEAIYSMWHAAMPGDTFPASEYEICKEWQMPATRGSGSYELLNQENIEEWGNCWRRNLAPSLIGSARTASAISWRYMRHPVFKYNLYIARNGRGDIRGLVAFRIIPLPGAVSAVRITDFLYSDSDSADILMTAIYENSPQNVAFMEFVALGNKWEELKRMGFERDKGNLFSVCFSPPDFTRCSIMSAFASNIPGLSSADLVNSSETYITIADGDQDRPN